MIRRRLLTATTLPLLAGLAAAQTKVVQRIGIVLPTVPVGVDAAQWQAFHDELRLRGWIDGQNLGVLMRHTERRPGAAQALSAELVAAGAAAIVVNVDDYALAARRATSSVPVVVINTIFPVELGLVASLARPGGNVTGISNQSMALGAKNLELARLLLPDLRRMAIIWQPAVQVSALAYRQNKAGAESQGIEVVSLPVDAHTEWEQLLAEAVRARVQYLVWHPLPLVMQNMGKPFADWAMRHRILVPGPAPLGFVTSYWGDFEEPYRLGAEYVDRILRGAKASELPVQQLSRFRLVINARSARAMGLTLPREVLLRADEVIE